jgi:hypothetical protein
MVDVRIGNMEIEAKRGTERSEIDLSEAKAPQGDRRRAGSTAEVAEIDAEWKYLNRGFANMWFQTYL